MPRLGASAPRGPKERSERGVPLELPTDPDQRPLPGTPEGEAGTPAPPRERRVVVISPDDSDDDGAPVRRPGVIEIDIA